MAEGIVKDIQIIDLQIENLQQQKKLKILQHQKLEMENLTSFSARGLSYQVSDVTSFGQVRLASMNTERKELYNAGHVTDAFIQDIQPQRHDNKIVMIQANRHADTFKFETPNDLVQKMMAEALDNHDEMRRRNCLSKALRQCCWSLVKDIPVQEGVFQDQLISAGCLDLEEWKLVTGSRRLEENQVRAILVIVLQKDLQTLLGFLQCIREMNHALVDKIVDCYKQHVQDGFGEEKRCWLCLVEDRVKMSTFVDKLFSEEIIDNELYMETSKEDMDPEKKKQVWNAALKSMQQYGDAQRVMTCLREGIGSSSVHKDICKMISEKIDNNSCELQCVCRPQMDLLKVNEFEELEDDDSGTHSLIVKSI